MTDVVFFFKASAPTAAIAWAGDTRLIAVDPPAGCMCGGTDPRCSTAYSCLYDSVGGLSGFLARYAKGITPSRIAFVGFSAAHGFLERLLRNPADRAAISAVLLLDATFGGGKSGYAAYVEEAARGEHLFATTTSNTGGDDGFQLVWQNAQAALGSRPGAVAARSPMPPPSGGAQQLGRLAFYLRYVNASGGSELPHWEMGKVLVPMLEAYLVPYWRGDLGAGADAGGGPPGWFKWGALGLAATLLAGLAAKRVR